MAISGKKERRWLSLSDVQWAELDAEAQERSMGWADVVEDYITSGRQTDASRFDGLDQRLERLTAVIEASKTTEANPAEPLNTPLDDWLRKPSGPDASEPDEYAQYAPFQDQIRAMAEEQKVINAERAQRAEAMRWRCKPLGLRILIRLWRLLVWMVWRRS